MILGSHNYYNSATQITKDFKEINFLVTKTLKIRLKKLISNKPRYTETYKRLYGNYRGRTITIQDVTLFPIYGCKTKPPRCFSQNVCNYTVEGRNIIHDKLKGYDHLIEYLLSTIHESEATEFSDNKISLITGQQGKCYATGSKLKIGNMECHHKKQRIDGGTHEYNNLVWLCANAHKLIHCKEQKAIEKYLGLLSLDEKGLKRVNSLRKLVGNSSI